MASQTSEDVRRHNLTLVTDALARRPLSRSELADATGLTRGAITSLVDELTDLGLVRESTAVAPESGRGRPRVLLDLAADEVAIVTAVLRSDTAWAMITTLAGVRLRRLERPVPAGSDPLDVLAEVTDAALALVGELGRPLADLTIVAGIPALGGGSALTDGTIVDVSDAVSARVPRLAGRSVAVLPLAAAAALGEQDTADDARMLHLSSDPIAGAAVTVAMGELRVADDVPVDPFHVAAVHDGDACVCGRRGCLATVLSLDALRAAADLDAHGDLVAAVRDGHPDAVAAFGAACDLLGSLLPMLTAASGATTVVLDGALGALADQVAEACLDTVPVRAARHDDAVVRGAERVTRARLLAAIIG